MGRDVFYVLKIQILEFLCLKCIICGVFKELYSVVSPVRCLLLKISIKQHTWPYFRHWRAKTPLAHFT